MRKVEIVAVQNRRELGQFVNLPYALHHHDPYWVAPLKIAQKELLDVQKHPFYRHAEMQCFLATNGKRVLGRVAAIVDRDFNRFHDEQAGFFGFFESVDDQEVSDALFAGAREWLRARGARSIRGPVNPSTNYECGLLVDGFDSSPQIMMTYNPPYYAALVEGSGFRKAKDLYAYDAVPTKVASEKVQRVAERALKSNAVSVRPIRMNAFAEEVEAVWGVYNSAWSRNWGFAPMTREEFLLMAKEMKQILVPELVLMGEVGGKLVGFALALPDINLALKHASGRLFPFGLLKILYYQRLIKALRVIALGVAEPYRTAGVAAGFYAALIRSAVKLGYQDCEMSWVLEDNVLMNRSLEALGARRSKTYRIYEWN